MPSVCDVGNIIDAEAQKWYPLASRPHTNLYKHIEGMVKRPWKKHVPAHLRRNPNFEDVLYAIFALAAAYPAGADTSALGALIKAKKLPDFKFYGHDLKTVDENQLRHLGCAAVDTLLSAFRDRCKKSERDKTAEFARLRSFMTALQTAFDVAVVTLNYDNIIYRIVAQDRRPGRPLLFVTCSDAE
jgi:hypothetical protein